MLKTNLNRFLTNQPTSLGKYQKTTEQQGPISRGNPNQYGKTGELTYLYGTGEDRGRQGKTRENRGRYTKEDRRRQRKTAEERGTQVKRGQDTNKAQIIDTLLLRESNMGRTFKKPTIEDAN